MILKSLPLTALATLTILLLEFDKSDAFFSSSTIYVHPNIHHFAKYKLTNQNALTKSRPNRTITKFLSKDHPHVSSNLFSATYNEKISEPEKEGLKKKLNTEFLSIAFPALIQLAAEPLAGLVDTAYLGRLGPDVLGGAGVAISAQVIKDDVKILVKEHFCSVR